MLLPFLIIRNTYFRHTDEFVGINLKLLPQFSFQIQLKIELFNMHLKIFL